MLESTVPCKAWWWWNSRLIATAFIFVSQSLTLPSAVWVHSLYRSFYRKRHVCAIYNLFNSFLYSGSIPLPAHQEGRDCALHNSTQCAHSDCFFPYRKQAPGRRVLWRPALITFTREISQEATWVRLCWSYTAYTNPTRAQALLHLPQTAPKAAPNCPCVLSRFPPSLPGDLTYCLLSVPKPKTQWRLPQRRVLTPPSLQHKAVRLTGPLDLQSSLLIPHHPY